MPRAVYILALGIFAMVTSEFVVAGLMPQMATGLGATIPQIGYLITAFAAAMAFGGPLLNIVLLKIRPRRALLSLFAIFLLGNLLAATAVGYGVMVVARVTTGVASQAFFGVALSLAAQLTRPEIRGRAFAVVMNGLMLGTLLGMPLSTLVGEEFGWRAAFWTISGLAVVAALCTLAGVPDLDSAKEEGDFRQELGVFRKPKLWLVLLTSMFIIGGTFTAFSYFNPILTQVSGFQTGTVPLLLVAYGAATVVGNTIVGRFADRYPVRVLLIGLVLNVGFLTGFALLAHLSVAAVLFMLGIGLVGVTMNPAMITRVHRTANARPLVNTVHSSFITIGVMIGSWGGGVAIGHFGLRAPLWLGAALAVVGVLTLVPDLVSRRAADSPAQPVDSAQPATTV
ncbi:Predicted arabinose efflux permease, MFS family [Saccharopolyspora antimicrobica]|uniref:MFS family arabinose efflux permease n=1 Tax=Saccharopolyspora antimicrobica TaxID=455193 RepID=A0A1I5HQ33_9PSEU|nr:MFS transporter [Saccharopolyspora antimicrobica]RKT82387.1 putative MFS family arabinose efflux permease [Saccharopolyspora antimicrobica]SFO50402.1 Predicted arabinose efflux permease, MFS family [Saccharopolyspora antimicrobica]